MLRLLCSAGIGLVLGGAATAVAGPSGAGIAALAAGSALVVGCGAASLVLRSRRRRSGRAAAARKRGGALGVVLSVVVLAAAAAAVILPHRVAFSQTLAAIPEGRLHADMRDPEPLERAVQALVDEIGHDTVASVVVTEDRVVAAAPTEPGERETDDWVYHRGAVEHLGPSRTQPLSALEQFELQGVRWSAFRPGLEKAGRLANTEELSEAEIVVHRSTETEPGSDHFAESVGPPEVVIALEVGVAPVFTFTFRMETNGMGLEVTDIR